MADICILGRKNIRYDTLLWRTRFYQFWCFTAESRLPQSGPLSFAYQWCSLPSMWITSNVLTKGHKQHRTPIWHHWSGHNLFLWITKQVCWGNSMGVKFKKGEKTQASFHRRINTYRHWLYSSANQQFIINPYARGGRNEWWKFVDTGAPGRSTACRAPAKTWLRKRLI